MTKRLGAVLIACSLGVGLLALTAFAAASSAHAQSADRVLCDRVATEPNDPDKPKNVRGTASIAPSDIATAIKFCKIASAGSRRALYHLGRAYATNRKIPEALAAYRKAADKGSTSAMVELGVMYRTGTGVVKNQAEAGKLFERAAKGGNARAIANLAALSGGGGAPSDPVEARALLAKAAEANSPEAQFQLGVVMAEGTGGPKDDVGARALFEKAAAQGYPDAMLWSGAFAQIGRGGPEDKSAAKAYFQKAAALGNEEAKLRLKDIDCPYVLKNKNGKVWSNLCI